jgi:hypothetical protein
MRPLMKENLLNVELEGWGGNAYKVTLVDL